MNPSALAEVRDETRREWIEEALRAEWRMIAAVSLRPCATGEGFEAGLRLDPIVVKGSLEQQGHPRTAAARERIESRRRAALADCVERVNRHLPPSERIQGFTVFG